MKNDLIERYIYAVTKQLPKKNREDVSMELRGLIDDMLSERCAVEPTERDVRDVLTELGTPRELYAKYDEDADKCLIGQPYYSSYKLALKAILAAIIGGLCVACVVLQILEPQSFGGFMEMLLSNLLEGVLFGYAAVTLLFTVMEKKGMKMMENFKLDDLPAVPKKKQEISVRDCVVGIALAAVFLVVFLAVPQTFCAVLPATKEVVPIFDTAVIQGKWYIILMFALVGILRETVKMMEKQYNNKVLATVVVSDVCSAALSVWWLTDNAIINPVFIENIRNIFVNDAEIIYTIFENFNIFLLAVLVLVLVLDTVETVVRTLRK